MLYVLVGNGQLWISSIQTTNEIIKMIGLVLFLYYRETLEVNNCS